MAQQKKVCGLDRFFGVTAAGSTIKVEIMAGLTTFFAMAYIIFVNPNILNQFVAARNPKQKRREIQNNGLCTEYA